MRIALTTWGFPTPFSKSMNGIATSTATIARSLAQQGHSVVVITSDADGMPASYFTDEGVEVHQAHPGNWHWYLSKLPGVPPALIRYLKLWEVGHAAALKFQALSRISPFDIVEVGPPAPWVNPSFRKFPATKCVAFAHGSSQFSHFQGIQPSWVERAWTYAEKQSAKVADGLLSPSQFVASFYQHAYGRLPLVLPYPVQIPKLPEHSEDAVRIITLGGTGNAKGADLIAQAMPRILSDYSHVSLSVISGEGRAEFDQLRSEYGDGRVSLLPWLPWDQLQQEFFSHSIFVSPSRFETFGLTVAEAMAAGLAVVVSDLPSHLEIVTEGETGLTFASGNAAQLADALRRAVEDSHLRKKIAGQARTWVAESLVPDTLAQRRVEFYQSLFLGPSRN